MEGELTYEQIRNHLETLSMGTALESLDNVFEAGRIEELSSLQILERLLSIEVMTRHERRVETNAKFAGLPYRKRLEEFDFSAQPSIDPNLIARLSTLTFLEEGTNILFLGPPGVGKTALAVGLALRALEEGHRIRFIACHDLVARHRKAVRADRVDQMLTTLLRPRLLILDEIGYTPLDRPEAIFLFEVIAKRCDREKSTIVTSNKSWGAWGEILPDQVMAAAILDRLLHRSITLNIQGESYRLREHRKAGLMPQNWTDSTEGRNKKKTEKMSKSKRRKCQKIDR